ncbi:MAG: 23S rRNA (adenine(2503)-C(2))-methyltransferase RlmN [Bacteroidetes bacterium]|nr:23S rRNA (adenine(2503)-C(2))-methyltransferase RlmN [Bacteroidota bacterium]
MLQHSFIKSNPDKQGLFGLFPAEIAETFSPSTPFRGRQVFDWLLKGVGSFEEMLNVPKQMRQEMSDSFEGNPFTTSVVEQQQDDDGTVKLLIRLSDGLLIESVLLTDEEGRKTACISSQVGCAMGCTFCKTAEMEFQRNLTASEIVEQFFHLSRVAGNPSHIVYMGMGEPLVNVGEVIKSIELFHYPGGLNISARKMTISTCGMVNGIKTLMEELSIPVKLAVSLTSANNEQRSRLMPINKRYPLPVLHRVLKSYCITTGKRITLEYVLLGGENDSETAGRELAAFAKDLNAVINVIPWNPGAENGMQFNEPSQQSISSFCSLLEKEGLRITRRYRRGRGINGACGQLAGLTTPK